ncbi:PITH domain-containing protein [Apodospora peruviana]|uniref:PITH domain-containing protein n=1 Tax=Apodospora peruviana TaxID=516989 RepID=A0AAE0M0U8_9PEZI|nr:PITH domain-containing protein [Apodospora peruviana]
MSGHCHDEHHDHHGHGHGGHGGHGGEHDHSDDITPALQFSLYKYINFDEINTFNEKQYGSGKAICKKTWDQRLSAEPELESDADEQLLINIPFTGQVKLHSILLRTSDSDSAPQTLKVIINREDIDFSSAEDITGTQVFELSRTSEIQELPVKRVRFNAVRRIALFFPDNFGQGDEDVTRITYIGFKGEWMQLGRAPANILYEAAANPSDHKVKGTNVNQTGSDIGGGGSGY